MSAFDQPVEAKRGDHQNNATLSRVTVSPTPTLVERGRPPEAPPYVCPDFCGFESLKKAQSLSEYCGFGASGRSVDLKVLSTYCGFRRPNGEHRHRHGEPLTNLVRWTTGM